MILFTIQMKPPICEVCDLDLRHELEKNPAAGGLVYFSDYQTLGNGMAGHPKGLGWFCAKHLKDAQFLSSLSKRMAMEQLRIKFNNFG